MPHNERQELARFFEAVRKGEADAWKNGEIYEKLLFYRFDEALSGTFPRFRQRVGEKEWRKLLHGFMTSDASHSPFVWQMPGDFRRYAKKRVGRKLRHLLWFEWQEVAVTRILMPETKEKEPDFDAHYRMGEAVKLKRLTVDVSGHERKGRFWTLVWQQPDGRSAWMQLTPFMARLLGRCDGKAPLMHHVKRLCRRYKVKQKAARRILKKSLKPLLNAQILVEV